MMINKIFPFIVLLLFTQKLFAVEFQIDINSVQVLTPFFVILPLKNYISSLGDRSGPPQLRIKRTSYYS